MRIDDILKQQAVQSDTQVKNKKNDQKDGAFATLLQTEMEGTGVELGSELVSGPGGPGALWGIESMSVASELSKPISAIEDTLSNIDMLREALKNNKSAKEIDQIVSRIDAGMTGLDEKLSLLPEDHPLRDVAEETKVTAYLESVKWKRGDYI